MIACREVRRLQPSYLELALAPVLEAEVRRHLAGCDECRAALAAREPVAALALRLEATDVATDASFVAEVMGGVHQRRLERRLTHRRRRWLAAAAGVAFALLGGWALMHQSGSLPQATAAARPRPAAAAAEPAFVEVEGAGVRLYQLDTAAQGTVKVAFVIDPHLEL